MTCEIDKDFYCTDMEGFISSDGTSVLCDVADRFCGTCKNERRKWPTPYQYKQENQGREYPDDWAVYIRLVESAEWLVGEYGQTRDGLYVHMRRKRKILYVVCAHTPWGRPPQNWRPS